MYPTNLRPPCNRRISELYAQGLLTDMHFLSMQTELNVLYDVLRVLANASVKRPSRSVTARF